MLSHILHGNGIRNRVLNSRLKKKQQQQQQQQQSEQQDNNNNNNNTSDTSLEGSWSNVKVHRTINPEKITSIQEQFVDHGKRASDRKKMEKRVDEMIDSGHYDERSLVRPEDADDDYDEDYKPSGRTYIRESYQVMEPDNKGDARFIADSMRSNEFMEKGMEKKESGWQLWNYKKQGLQTYDHDRDERSELSKVGLERTDDGSLFCGKFEIPADYEDYFTKPDKVTSRAEKNNLKRMEAHLGREKIEKRRPKRRTIIDDNEDEHTILQKKMSDRILEVLNDSFMFAHEDNNATRQENALRRDAHTGYGFFRSTDNDAIQDDELVSDPILSRSGIILTRALMSSDLRWVKVFWERDNDAVVHNVSGNGNGNDIGELDNEQDGYSNEPTNAYELMEQVDRFEHNQALAVAEAEAMAEGGEGPSNDSAMDEEEEKARMLMDDAMTIPEIISNLATNKAKRIVQQHYKDELQSAIPKDFSFGSGHTQMAQTSKVTLNISVPSLEQSLREPTPVVESSSAVKKRMAAERDMRYSQKYETLTDQQIQTRLTAITPRLRLHLGKSIKTKYVPNIFFVKDKDQKRMNVTMDLYETIVFPELVNAARKSQNKDLIRSQQLKNRFLGVFKTGSSSSSSLSTPNNMYSNNYNNEEEEEEKDNLMDLSLASEILKEDRELDNPYEQPSFLYKNKSTPANTAVPSESVDDAEDIELSQMEATEAQDTEGLAPVDSHTKVDPSSIFKQYNKRQQFD
ncbi:hypothetical protein SAMD00019534_016170 [Acytostelium subglobosum LB1]|uniref:hypothetical protein n=1 Tax=Acytostelium subglobosum LB1 TaxID=1410327 RepID=UPI000644D575|nr:hypothetical protein SAMD00019534_016170 [Acytostelium subglobosum LB1]GAM18442.1 hypothetical protein SAMD00019534_016170 [Acytostelium subglobosum LB1]|eukprot:XP_012757662.1 hypothetical protein SAMD00019534_016170 [Acytostelium subglobosum LB1]